MVFLVARHAGDGASANGKLASAHISNEAYRNYFNGNMLHIR